MDRVEADTEGFVLRDLTLDLCASNVLPPVATPRSLDLAHLRTALWFQAAEPIHRFPHEGRVAGTGGARARLAGVRPVPPARSKTPEVVDFCHDFCH